MAITMTASIDGAASRAFDAALKELADSLGDACADAPRQAALNICAKFKSNTKSAKKYPPKEDYVIVKSMAKPKAQYITAKDGTKLRRWMIIRPPRGVSYDAYGKNESDVKKHRLVLFRRGLAKRSWGWCAYNIWHGKKSEDPWRPRKRDKRNPQDATKESMSRGNNGTLSSSGFARICNRLDYAAQALLVSVDDVLSKAANTIVYNIARKKIKRSEGKGMSDADIKSYAQQVAHDFKHSFTD